MKKLLALLLLLGIVGCASIAEQENAYRADTKTRELAKKTVYEKYNEDLIAPKAMAKPISGYGVAIAGNTRESQTIKYQSLANDQAIMNCKHLYNDECRLFMQGDVNVWGMSKTELLKIRAEGVVKRRESEEERKLAILSELRERCISFGFTGNNNIATCIQREAQTDKKLAMQKLELTRTMLALEQAQSRTYMQNQTQPKQEEDLPWLIKFLGDVIVETSEAYANKSKNDVIYPKDKKTNDIHKNCRPNC
mgnify:CR=1 FL=1